MNRTECRRIFPLILSLAGMLTTVCLSAAEKPNIVCILADDLGWADVGFHDPKRAETPNLDRLAAEGIELDRFYAAPMCSPARAALMAGRYPIRFGLARAVIPPWRMNHGLPVQERTLPEALAEAGYEQRGAFGKWHLGHGKPKWHPLSQGFTRFHGHYNGAIDYFTKDREGQPDWHLDREPLEEEGYTTDLIAKAASRWITGAAEKDAPYFCYVAFNAPHSPFQAKPEDLARYERMGGDVSLVNGSGGKGKLDPATKRRAIAAMVWSMDQGIGRILEAIEASGEADRTIVWFFSDNGGIADIPDNNLPLRGNKLDAYEGGVRVAACVRWPAAWPGGREIAEPLSVIDVLPTLLAASGQAPAGAPNLPLDGIDAGTLLRGEVERLPPRELYHYHGQSGPRNEVIAISTPEWKLVVLGPQLTSAGLLPDHKVQLFRIAEDPYEQKDLVSSHPEVVRGLAEKLIRFRALQPADAVPPYGKGPGRNFVPPEKWRIRE